MTRKYKCTYKPCGKYSPLDECTITNIGKFCSIEHAGKYGIEASQKALKKELDRQKSKDRAEQKKQRRINRKRKEKLKTVSDYIKEAQICVNKYIRERDYGKPCISCGSTPSQKYGGTMEAGHYRSRGAASHLRFNTNNIHLQCVKCNRYKSGNAVDYRLGLIRKIGIEKVEALENDNAPRKFTIEYLKRIKRIFSKRARMIEKRRINGKRA